MRLIQIPVPEDHLDQVAQALVGLSEECPRHGKRKKLLVVVDECQWQLLSLIELTGHGRVEIDVADGRPCDIHHYVEVAGVQVRQDYRTTKDDLGKVRRLVGLLEGPNGTGTLNDK